MAHDFKIPPEQLPTDQRMTPAQLEACYDFIDRMGWESWRKHAEEIRERFPGMVPPTDWSVMQELFMIGYGEGSRVTLAFVDQLMAQRHRTEKGENSDARRSRESPG